MTGRLVRRSLQVAGLAAGILMFTGGVAQADAPSNVPEDGHHHGHHSKVDLDQGSLNICGDNGFNSGVIFNATDCDAGNVAVKGDGSDHYLGGGSHKSADVDQGAGNVCGNNAFNSGVIFNGADCDAGNAAVKGD